MNARSQRAESARNGLATFEPAEEGGDVHSARTTIATLPDSFLDDLRRGKAAADEPTTAKYNVLPDVDVVKTDAPPPPPPTPAPPPTALAEPAFEAAQPPAPSAPVSPQEAPVAAAAAAAAAATAPAAPAAPAGRPRAVQERQREDRRLSALVAVGFALAVLALAASFVFAY